MDLFRLNQMTETFPQNSPIKKIFQIKQNVEDNALILILNWGHIRKWKILNLKSRAYLEFSQKWKMHAIWMFAIQCVCVWEREREFLSQFQFLRKLQINSKQKVKMRNPARPFFFQKGYQKWSLSFFSHACTTISYGTLIFEPEREKKNFMTSILRIEFSNTWQMNLCQCVPRWK